MSDSRFPIGPGNMEICQQCAEHLKHDVDHLIADEAERVGLPAAVEYDRLRELFKLRRGQHGNGEGK